MTDSNTSIPLIISRYKQLRSDSLIIMGKIVEIRNKLTYVTKENINDTISTLIDVSRFSLLFSSELHEIITYFKDIQDEIKLIIQKIDEILSENSIKMSNISLPYEDIIENMKQQYILEVKVKEIICNFEDKLINEDVMITLISCFKYPPYLKLSDLDQLIMNNSDC